jgi:sugar lactone lactonase YvrE
LLIAHSFLVIPYISPNARWTQNGVTVAGYNKAGHAENQLDHPFGIFVDDDQAIVVADFDNNRIMQWRIGDRNGRVVAGGAGEGGGLHQLNLPTDALIDKETNSIIICDQWNSRVVRWSRQSPTTQGEILIPSINCWGLAMDNQRYLYVSVTTANEVRRYKMGDNKGTVVAGGNGKGNGVRQLSSPYGIFVDQEQSVYVADHENHRVMKWERNAEEGTVLAGGQSYGSSLTQLYKPNAVFVDALGTLYVTDSGNKRVMRWHKGATQGAIAVGGNGGGDRADQLDYPAGLSFDYQGNLYVVDGGFLFEGNHRVQRFAIQP